jgi:putative SOS response-associated peptidase YedK
MMRKALPDWADFRQAAGRRPGETAMCNDYEEALAYDAYCKMMEDLALGIPTDETEGDVWLQAADIRIGDIGPVMRAKGNVIELNRMKFGLPPSKPGGKIVFNFVSEGRKFANSNRCIIPASAFFEFTGVKYPKTKHRFTLVGSTITAIAGIWRDGTDGQPPAFTMLTTKPGPDIAPFHDRQIVILRPEDWAAWIDLSKPEAELLRPLPEGSLMAETIKRENPIDAQGELFPDSVGRVASDRRM